MSLDGWIKSWRKILKSRVFRNPELLKVWIWCLHKASHTHRWVPIKTGRGETEVEVQAGQFIYGRHRAAKELHMKPSSVRGRMEKLKDLGNIAMQPDTHCSLVTICKWADYQETAKAIGQATGQATDNQRTTNGQPTDTDKKEEKDKNVQEEKIGAAANGKITWDGSHFYMPPVTLADYIRRFPTIPEAALRSEIADCATYHRDKGTKIKSPAGRITRWLKNAVKDYAATADRKGKVLTDADHAKGW